MPWLAAWGVARVDIMEVCGAVVVVVKVLWWVEVAGFDSPMVG